MMTTFYACVRDAKRSTTRAGIVIIIIIILCILAGTCAVKKGTAVGEQPYFAHVSPGR